VATSAPPLYYALEAVPYLASPSHNFLDRLLLMRLFSAVCAALTVLATFLFLRELFPGTPWAWTVGALGVAFQPMFAFISGGVNNDNLLYVSSAFTFLAVARAFRRGLTPARGAAIGAALAVGLLTKLNAFALLPGVALALLFLVHRAAPDARPAARKGAALAGAVAVAPYLLYMLLNVSLWDRRAFSTGEVATPSTRAGHPQTLGEELSYIWQLYLPRLPFLRDTFPGPFPLWDLWFRGFIGRFGWLDYDFPTWVNRLALWIYLPLLGLVGAALAAGRRRLRRRWAELASYTVMALGVLLVIGHAGYAAWASGGYPFEQPRYLLPLLPLYGALLALAARGAGRRFGPAVGVLIVALAVAHGLFAQLLTLSRYYG
jgi:4-amino-4-deoxy-L-arabinose transferase-like glycosyltransferase